MTSLEKQLKSLRTAVTAQLGVERIRVSLLFDKNEAGALYVENALQIGRAGLAELRKIDPKIATGETAELFDDAAVNIQRALLSKRENAELDEKLERLIIQISAYLHHLAAKQILEWLIFRFQIHSFNAETLFIAFLPYHNTNIFGRLLSILDLKGLEYDWTKEYAKIESPISLRKLITICISRNHSLLTLVHNYIERVRELFNAKFMETKLPHLFTFYASLCAHILAESNVTDDLISKILPFLARGLVSDIVSLRLSCLIVVSQLLTKVTLVGEKLQPMVKLIMLKMDSSTMKESMDTLVVVCQRQGIMNFPLKPKTALKLAKKDENLHISDYLKSLYSITDMKPFICTFARTFIPMLAKFDEEEKSLELCNFCISCLDLTMLNDQTSEMILNLVFELLAETNNAEKIPDIFYKHIRALVFRFPNAFTTVRSEWQIRDENVYNMLLKACKFQQHEIESFEVIVAPTGKRKRRRRRSSARSSTGEEGSEPHRSASSHSKPAVKRKPPEEIQKEQLNAVHEPRKIVFKGDPVEKLIDAIKAEEWALAEAGLEKLTSESYLKNRTASDFENFFAKMVAVALAEGVRLKTAIKNALSQLPVDADFALSLLKPYTETKTSRRNRGICHWDCFSDEDRTKFEARRLFMLELLTTNENLQASTRLFQQLYEILKEAMEKNADENGGYKLTVDDLQLDVIADIIRQTQNHRILRDCLQLLTCAVTVSPKKVLVQLMSVYTFMGDGVLKKDNDLTLSVIEETLNVLFSNVRKEKDPLFHEHMITTSRLFAASVTDIPAHRRDRILRAVARAATSDYLWAVIAILFERYCLNWPKRAEGRTSVELYEEMSTMMASEYDAVEQLSCAATIIEHIIRLGGDFPITYTNPASTTVESQNEKFLTKIFDRTKHSVQKLRHYRFAILGWIARLLESSEFQVQLSLMDEQHSYERLLETAKRLLFCSVQLDDFVTTETLDAEKRGKQEGGETVAAPASGDSGQQYSYNCKYWIAISVRADIVIEKFQNLLPSHVCGPMVADVLEQTVAVPKLRDRALQFLNAKLLLQDGSSCIRRMETNHLDSLIGKFNSWIQPSSTGNDDKIDVDLCQKAAHTLKLIARNMSSSNASKLLSETLGLTIKLLTDRNTLDEAVTGNLLLLAGELMRFQRVKNAILYANALAGVCTEILSAVLETQNTIGSGSSGHQASPSKDSGTLAGRRRRAQHSMSGRYVGSGDALLICSLICLQRVLENFSGFVFKYLSPIVVIISRLCCICDYTPSADISTRQLTPNKYSTIQQRISYICRALGNMELRVVLDSFAEACKTLMAEPAAVGVLLKIFSSNNEIKNRTLLLKYVVRVCDVYFSGLDIRLNNAKLEMKELIDNAELMVIDSFLEIIDNLSENEFRTVTKGIRVRLEEAVAPEAKMESRQRLITIFRFFNRFYESYKNLSLPHFGQFFGFIPDILSRCNLHHTEPQSLLFSTENDSNGVAAVSINHLLIVIIDFLTNCARNPVFFTLERAKAVLDCLVNELENADVTGHELRCVPHLAQCLYHIIDCQNEILMDVINKIMLKTRSRNSKIRYRTLLLLEWLFEHMGDAVAPVLPSVLPFLSELLEDDSKKVEMQCDAVIGILRKNFGEEITEGYV